MKNKLVILVITLLPLLYIVTHIALTIILYSLSENLYDSYESFMSSFDPAILYFILWIIPVLFYSNHAFKNDQLSILSKSSITLAFLFFNIFAMLPYYYFFIFKKATPE
ncbi:MAG: hypothetical protein OCC49_01245 [Fibrobacterales bacterium]